MLQSFAQAALAFISLYLAISVALLAGYLLSRLPSVTDTALETLSLPELAIERIWAVALIILGLAGLLTIGTVIAPLLAF